MSDQGPSGGYEAVPRRTRWFVRVFLVAFVVCGLAGIEAWPLSGFRLFSHLRHERTVGWTRVAIGPDGLEREVDLARLPSRYGSFVLAARSFGSRPKSEQDAMCKAWVSGLRGIDAEVDAMRVYRLDRSLLPRRDGRPAAKPARTLAFICTAAGVTGPGAGR